MVSSKGLDYDFSTATQQLWKAFHVKNVCVITCSWLLVCNIIYGFGVRVCVYICLFVCLCATI